MKACRRGDLELVQTIVAARAILDLKSKVRRGACMGRWEGSEWMGWWEGGEWKRSKREKE